VSNQDVFIPWTRRIRPTPSNAKARNRAPWDKVHRRSWQQTATCTERLQLDEIGDAASCAEPQQPETSLYAHPYARSFRGTADLTSGVTVLSAVASVGRRWSQSRNQAQRGPAFSSALVSIRRRDLKRIGPSGCSAEFYCGLRRARNVEILAVSTRADPVPRLLCLLRRASPRSRTSAPLGRLVRGQAQLSDGRGYR
jgi:hypothetical protein